MRAEEEPEGGGGLVVSGARGMESFSGAADFFDEPAFDIEVDVFIFGFPWEFAVANFFEDVFESALDIGGVFGGYDAAGAEHLRVGDGGGGVEFGESFIEMDGRVELCEFFVERLGESG